MAVNPFTWNRFDDDSVVAFATDLGFRGIPAQARDFLATRVPRPTDDFVQAAMHSITRVWLTRQNIIATTIVRELLDGGAGKKGTRLDRSDDWLGFFNSLRLAPLLRDRLLSWLVTFGEGADIETTFSKRTSWQQRTQHNAPMNATLAPQGTPQALLSKLRQRFGRKAPVVRDFERAIARNDHLLMARVLGRFPDLTRDMLLRQAGPSPPHHSPVPPAPPTKAARRQPEVGKDSAPPQFGRRVRQRCACGNLAMASGDKCHDCGRSE